jgi:hypothetical protein
MIKSYIASGDIKLAYIKGADLCPGIMTKPFGADSARLRQPRDGKWRASSNIPKKYWAITFETLSAPIVWIGHV